MERFDKFVVEKRDSGYKHDPTYEARNDLVVLAGGNEEIGVILDGLNMLLLERQKQDLLNSPTSEMTSETRRRGKELTGLEELIAGISTKNYVADINLDISQGPSVGEMLHPRALTLPAVDQQQ